MKKVSLSLDMDGVKDFFIKHGEKVAFGVIVIVAALLIKLGFGVEKLSENQNPDDLIAQAEQARSHINEVDFTPFAPFRKADTSVPDVIRGQKELKPERFAFELPKDASKEAIKRADPELRAPFNLETHGMVATIPLNYPGTNEIDALPQAYEEVKRKSKTTRSSSSGEDDYGSDYGEDEGSSSSLEDQATPKSVPEVQTRELEGVAGLDGQEAFLYGTYVIGVKAVVPYELQWKEYENKLETAMGWDPIGDRPRYLRMAVEREETKPDGTVVEWADITDEVYGFSATYSARAPEVCDVSYTDRNLTLPIPAVLCKDYRPLVSHSDVPLAESAVEMIIDGDETEVERTAIGDLDPFAEAKRLGRATSAARSGDDYDEYEDDGSGDDYGSGTYYTAEMASPSAQYKLIRFFDFRGKPGSQYRYRVRVWMEDPNNPSLVANSGSDYGSDDEYGGVSIPQGRTVPIAGSMLESDVRKRIRDWRASPEYAAIPEEQSYLRTARATEWSEPSSPILVPPAANQFYAGGVVAPTRIDAKGVMFEAGERHGEIVSSVWQKKFAVSIPVKHELHRASVLNSNRSTEVLNPRDLTIREFVKVVIDIDGKETKTPIPLKTDAIVIDVMGGEKLATSIRKSDFRTPAEVLIYDAGNNRFVVRDEFSDIKNFRHATFADQVAADAAAEDEYEEMDEGDDYGDDYGGY